MTNTDDLGIVAQLPGSSLKWIHIAEREFERAGLDLDKYKIIVVEEDNSMIVILKGLNEPKVVRGSIGQYPGYEVEIGKKDLKVIRSNYVR
jgi:hypothetical protein